MKLLVLSHKRCWKDSSSPTGYASYGGFPLQMRAIASLFESTVMMMPLVDGHLPAGSIPLTGRNMTIHPLPLPKGADLRRKLNMMLWIPSNAWTIWKAIRKSDAVHTPVPGDIGLIGMAITIVQRKPLFVRHCANWLRKGSRADRFLRFLMERYAGGNRLMYATGYSHDAPSRRNAAIKWIFSTSLTGEEMQRFGVLRTRPAEGKARLVIVCRQDPGKNVDSLIRALAILRKKHRDITLSVVGDGILMEHNKQVAVEESVNEAVTFHGKLDHDAVMETLHTSDIFVFPTDSEGFPKSVLEALAHGLPVVSTAVSVIPHLLSNGSGVLLENTTPESIVDGISRVLENDVVYEAMSRSAINRASEYSMERWSATLKQDMETAWNVQLQ